MATGNADRTANSRRCYVPVTPATTAKEIVDGLRVEVEGLLDAHEAMYALEVLTIRDLGYEAGCEQCRRVVEDGTTSWFHRTRSTFHSNIETRLTVAPNAFVLALVAGDQRFEPLVRFLSNIEPIASTHRKISGELNEVIWIRGALLRLSSHF